MKSFFTKVGRFFWSWGFLKFVLWAVTLIILFYVEEDWRGARAWGATKAEWEAKGESFDYNKFIPPPIPDDQNLAAIPLFKLEPAKYDDGSSYLGEVTLNRAMRSDLPGNDLPPMGNWQKGELPDMAKIRNVIATDYSAAFKDAKPPDDTLAQFNAIFPFLTDFLATAATRPLCRFSLDYSISPPGMRPLGPIIAQIKLSKILTLHAILALDHHQSDLALEDIKTNYELASGVKHDPSLVGGLVAIGMGAINYGAIYDGVTQHEWSDAQLVELDRILKPINFLADYQFAMRSEVVQSIGNFDYYEKLADRVHRLFPPFSTNVSMGTRFTPPWPDGWWDGNKSLMATSLFRTLATVDPQAHRVFPQALLDLQRQTDETRVHWTGYVPWKIFATISVGPIAHAMQHYAEAQVWIDEARIACALERYHLVHGIYPDSLDALVPACIDSVPHDIMNGQPYHYQLRPDGTYLLYSVGWNQTDEGGMVVFKKDNPKSVDYNEGDWVWPTPQLNPQK